MRSPVGVVAAAVVLALMTVVGLLGSLASLVISFLATGAIAEPTIPGMRLVMILTTVVMMAFFLFCAWTVLGLFRMRRWARYSILAIGGLEFCMTALTGLVMIFMRNVIPPPPTAGPTPIGMPAMMVAMGAFYGGLSLIGAWWLVYFNLAHVRAAFSGAGTTSPELATMGRQPSASWQARSASGKPPAPSGWRIVIVVWACLALFSSLFFPLVLVLHLPMFLFGVVVRGTTATVVVLLMLAVQLFLGLGLLRKWRAAWYVALAWQVYTVAYFAAMALPGMPARFEAYQLEVMGRWHFTTTTSYSTQMMTVNMHAGMAIGIVVGVATVVLLTMALIRRRGDYLQAG